MIEIFDAILKLLKYDFLSIFWFWLNILIAIELVIYTFEKLMKIETMVRWYDLALLMIIFILTFLMSYRLYILTIESIKRNS